MKFLFLIVVLLTASIARGAVPAHPPFPEDADLVLFQNQTAVRGRIVTMSIYATENVKGLSHFRFTFSPSWVGGVVDIPNGQLFGANGFPIYFVAPMNSADVRPGRDIHAGISVLKAPSGGIYLLPGMSVFTTIQNGDASLSGDTPAEFDISFSSPVSGPGEILQIDIASQVYISGFRSYLLNQSAYVYFSSLKLEDTSDVSGNSLTLKAATLPFKADVRQFGDVNGDGKVTGADAVLVLKSLVGLESLNDVQSWYADVQPCSTDGQPMDDGRLIGDGQVTVKDARRILEVITGTWGYWWPDGR